MITILLIIIGAYTVDIYWYHGKPKHTNFYQTMLSLVIAGLLYEVIAPVFGPDTAAKKLAKVDFSPTATLSTSDATPRPEWNPLVDMQKEEEQRRRVLSEMLELSRKYGLDNIVVCGHCGDKASESEHEDYNFIWPVKGKIIQAFQESGNDGINIRVNSGTAVEATEGGEVAYAGEELAGYGKMVLIRHPNGFVSAYAHNSELKVMKGDKVKKGQVIALSGQSGNMISPQLHFELRKGSTPVDPIKFMPDNNKIIGSN